MNLVQKLFILLFTLCISTNTLAQSFLKTEYVEPEFLPVEQAYQASVLSLDNQVIVNWQIEPAYYLYGHAFQASTSGKTLNFTPSSNGIEKFDEYFGDVTVYYQFADIIIENDEPLLSLSITSQGCADAGLCYPPRTQYFSRTDSSSPWVETDAPPSPTALSAPATTTEPNSAEEDYSFIYLIVLAFAGGLILNLMPCVLPVLTLKSLSFANTSDAKERIAHGWAYTAGVVCSFLLIASILIALKQAGAAVGWGFQLQSPLVIASLIYLFFIIGMNLIGAFEFKSIVVDGQDKHSISGAFMTGVLACVVASPCTAPFMGTAIGAALSLSTIASLTIFLSLGVGMALPFLLISYVPSLGRLLPKPGNWMNTLKEFLAFPMFATAIWLLWVATYQVGANGVAWILSVCVLLALLFWWKKQLGFISIVIALAIAIAVSTPIQSQRAEQSAQFNLEELDTLVSKGQPVFVNVTASWCITCKANERVALKTEAVQNILNSDNVEYIVADWTNYNPEISALLNRYNRNGIPLYLVFTKGDIKSPTILPQILTESTVLDALKNIY